ncbi:hypothetical protein [Sinorhizobium meliloti]|uniref:hypothetical protein n=1 Tax=Rhizobium meliloti TaxID=382 RepID=UPI0013E3D175|nr:hypothetical protein [Sinorhizobium meliloti]
MAERILIGLVGIYAIGAPIVLGMTAKALGPISLFVAAVWPVSALIYFGNWIVS